MNKKIAVIAGDGIGPEITAEAVKTLQKIGILFHHNFMFEYVPVGGGAIDRFGTPLPERSLDALKMADSILLGAVGGPKWEGIDPLLRPERALLTIRKELGLYANLRPVSLFPALRDACPLRADIAEAGIDLVVVRELTGGLYFGKRETTLSDSGKKQAWDSMVYTEEEIERIARAAFAFAMKRRKKLTSVDKANVLDTSRLWREVFHRIKEDYPEVEYTDMLVDNCAMQLVKNPAQFDVIATENMFGDILSDEASELSGSIGLIPSASLGDNARGLYEPIHGSAPDIAGQNRANPIATILSAALMLESSFGLQEEARAVQKAVAKILCDGYATEDIYRNGKKLLSCSQMGDMICANILYSS